MIPLNMTDTPASVGNKYPVGEDAAAIAESHNICRRQAIVSLLQVALLYLALAVPAVTIREDLEPDIFLLFLSFWGSFCFFILWRSIDWRGHRFLSFGPLFLIASACFRLVSFFDVLSVGNRIEKWPVSAEEPLLFIAYGEINFVVGALILVVTWLVLRGHEHSIAIFESWRYDLPTLVFGYIIATCVVLSERLLGFDFSFLGSIVHVFVVIAMLTILLISLGSSQRPTWGRCVGLPAILSLPLIYGALGTGMKENIIFAILPVGIGVFVVVKGWWQRALVGLMMALGLAAIAVFVNILRQVNWIEEKGLSMAQVYALSAEQFQSENDLWATSFENLLLRKNLLDVNGLSFAIVENHGHFENFSPAHALEIFIPRGLWADKPLFRPGADFNDLVFGPGTGERSSTAAGFFSALYLGSGLGAVLIYSMLLGALYALSLSVVIHFGSSFAQIVCLAALGYKALRLDEGWPVYEFSGVIALLVTSIFFGKLISVMQKQ